MTLTPEQKQVYLHWIADVCYIVGKGSSLQYIDKSYFFYKDANVITLNEAILPIEKLGLRNRIFSMQKDGASPKFRNVCQCKINGAYPCPYDMVPPRDPKTILLCHELESLECYDERSNRFLFNNEELGLTWEDFSALSAIEIARQYLGAKRLIFVSFDAHTKKDYIKYNPADGSKEQDKGYPFQRDRINARLGDTPVEWITPTDGFKEVTHKGF